MLFLGVFRKFPEHLFCELPLGGSFFQDLSEAVVCRCSIKWLFLKMSQNSQKKHLCQSLFFNKVARWGLGRRSVTLFKNTLVSVFSCEFCDIFKNTFFIEHVRTAASGLYCSFESRFDMPICVVVATHGFQKILIKVKKMIRLE